MGQHQIVVIILNPVIVLISRSVIDRRVKPMFAGTQGRIPNDYCAITKDGESCTSHATWNGRFPSSCNRQINVHLSLSSSSHSVWDPISSDNRPVRRDTAYRSDGSGSPMNERFDLRKVYPRVRILSPRHKRECPAFWNGHSSPRTELFGKTFWNRTHASEQVELVPER